MRDELDGRMWVEHHEQFAAIWSTALSPRSAPASAGSGQWDGSTHQLLALVAAFVITGLTFNTTAPPEEGTEP